MQGKKLFSILGTFDETEWRACNKFLKFCSKKGARTITIFNYIYRNRDILYSETPEIDRIQKKTCPEISRKSFLNRLSELSKDVDSFLVFSQMRKDESSYEYKKTLAQIYKQKGLYPMFENSVNALISELENDRRLDLFRSHRLHELYHSYYFSDLHGKKRKDPDVLNNSIHYCGQFAQNLMSYYETENFNAQRIRPSSTIHRSTMDNRLVDVLENYDRLTRLRDQDSFSSLRNFLFSSHERLSGELAQTILISLLNHCIYKTKLGDLEVVEDMAALNLFGLENELLLEYKRLTETRFLNIVDVISKSTLEVDRTEFLAKWSAYVKTSDRESLENMANAMWFFAKEEYGKTLQHLNYFTTNLTSLNNSLRARWMQICSLCSLYPFHEAKEESINSAISYFRRHRESLDVPTFEGSLNLIKIVRLIWEDYPIKHIESAMVDSKFLIFKYWIRKELVKRKSKNE